MLHNASLPRAEEIPRTSRSEVIGMKSADSERFL